MLLTPAEYKDRIAALVERHGSVTGVPLEEMQLASEKLRAYYVTQLPEFSSEQTWPAAFRTYSIRPSIWVEEVDPAEATRKKARHADKNKALKAWCEEHIGVIVRVDELAEACGVSPSKARSFIYDRVDVFSKAGRGMFLVRDPKSERKAEKQK